MGGPVEAALTCSDNTKRSYTPTVDYASATFGDKRVRSIGTVDVLAFLARIQEPKTKTVGQGDKRRMVTVTVSSSTVAKHLRVLSSILGWGGCRRPRRLDPVERIPKQQRPKGRRREAPYFTDAELARLFAGGDSPPIRPKDAPPFRLALYTGIRQGELLALQWGDVDLGAATIRVRRKAVAGYRGDGQHRRVELTVQIPLLTIRQLGRDRRASKPRKFSLFQRDAAPASPTLSRRPSQQ